MNDIFLLQWQNMESQIKEYTCDICGKFCKSQNSLRVHIKIHGSKTFKCQYCDKQFLTSDSTKRHEKIHFEVEKVKCYRCDKSFSTVDRLLVFQWRSIFKVLVTNVTGEWFYFQVNLIYVILQTFLQWKGALAWLTFKSLNIFMDKIYMLIQFKSEYSLANLTL